MKNYDVSRVNTNFMKWMDCTFSPFPSNLNWWIIGDNSGAEDMENKTYMQHVIATIVKYDTASYLQNHNPILQFSYILPNMVLFCLILEAQS